ncbi:serine hydrolase domain-containing protein [Candidatus Poribacteria bacterium]
MEQLEQIILDGTERGIFPGAVACLRQEEEPLLLKAYGHRMVTPQRLPMREDTLFDLASLTKPVATATSVMLLKERGLVDLDEDLSAYLPEFTRRGISLFHLLTHTSGLPAWKPLYIDPGDRSKVVKYLGELPLEYETGSKVVYSCLGYILLGEMVRAVTGTGLGRFAYEHIFEPLGMKDTFFSPPPERRGECAATEDSSSFEKRMSNYRSYKWREGVVVGEVHDENSNSLGGVAGNAGLFSTASDLAKFCRMIINDGENILSYESVQMMSTPYTRGLGGSRSIGWIILQDGALYHTGFTGGAIWIDRQHRSAAILLTNRVHPDATKEGIGTVREEFYAEFRRYIGNCTLA